MLLPEEISLIGKGDDDLVVTQVLDINKKYDQIFGLCDQPIIDEDLPDIYADTSTEALNTPYLDYYQLISQIQENEVFVDFGSGLSRSLFLGESLNRKIICIEQSKRRVEFVQSAMNKQKIKCGEILNEDFSDETFHIPDAHLYYCYLPNTLNLLKLLYKLYLESQKKTIRIAFVESHGDLFGHLYLHSSWLSLEKELRCSTYRHNKYIRIYQSKSGDFLLKQWMDAIQQEKLYVIRNQQGRWFGSLKNASLTYTNEILLELTHPSVLIKKPNSKNIMGIPKEIKHIWRNYINKKEYDHGHIVRVWQEPKKVEFLDGSTQPYELD